MKKPETPGKSADHDVGHDKRRLSKKLAKGDFPSMAQSRPSSNVLPAGAARPRKPARFKPGKFSANTVTQKRYRKYLVRIVGSLVGVVLLASVAIAVALPFLKGQTIKNPALTSQLQSSIQQLLGMDYRVSVADVGLEVKSLTNIALSSENVEITLKDTDSRIALLTKASVLIEPFSLFLGAPKFDKLRIDGAQVDFSAIKQSGEFTVASISSVLEQIRTVALRLKKPFDEGTIKSINLANISLNGLKLGRQNDDTILISRGSLSGDRNGNPVLAISSSTALSHATIHADWLPLPAGGDAIRLEVGPLNLREWINSPDTGDTAQFGIGSDAQISLNALLPYSAEGAPLQPVGQVSSGKSRIRIGRKYNSQLDAVTLNFRLIPEKNQIELERSQIRAGAVLLGLVGGIRPVDQEAGYEGPLQVELIAEKMFGLPASTAAQPIQATAIAGGIWQPADHELKLDNVRLTTTDHDISGTADIRFTPLLEPSSPAIVGTFKSAKFQVEAVKQFWPFFMAHGARDWVREHVKGGLLKNVDISLDIQSGRISGLSEGDGFNDSEVSLSTEISDVEIDTFGDLPPIKKASGTILLVGNSLFATANRGEVTAANGNSLSLASAKFEIPEYVADKVNASIKIALDGKLASLAEIANAAPLKIADRILTKPTTLSGEAHANLAAEFELLPQSKIENLRWNAMLNLENASASKPIFGRKVEKAELFVEATQSEVRVKGQANIDGVNSKIKLVEPLNGANTANRVRNISGDIDGKVLAGLGINVSPVIKGPFSIEISSAGNSANIYKLDLTDADISLPWISWLKGAGIPATAEFEYFSANGTSKLKNFVLKGDGFDAKGDLTFSKDGLLSADLKNITLVGEENFDLQITKAKSRYEIKVTGKDFDGRSLINQIIHEKGFASEKSSVDISLQAELGSIIGFGSQIMNGATVSYKTDNGLLSLLEVRGKLEGDSDVSVTADRKGDVTTFQFEADNAGAALSIVDLYRKMQGGSLEATLTRTGNGPFVGPVLLRKFVVVGEERLSSLIAAPVEDNQFSKISGELKKINTSSIGFQLARADIIKSANNLQLSDGIIRNMEIGFTFEGVLYDESDQMNIRGTFMPLIAVSRLVSLIPFVGQIFSNGSDSALLGITYRLKGPAKNPQISVNPMSIVAPGIFNKVFEFQK